MISTGKYRFFYKYLDERYADRVVLTFRQIEDLLGFALPAVARTDPKWWTQVGEGATDCAEAWTLAHRTAAPNLLAQHVVFDRVG